MKINLPIRHKINKKDRKDQMQKDQLGKHPYYLDVRGQRKQNNATKQNSQELVKG